MGKRTENDLIVELQGEIIVKIMDFSSLALLTIVKWKKSISSNILTPSLASHFRFLTPQNAEEFRPEK